MKGAVIWITGDDADRNDRVLHRLRDELSGRGGRVEIFHSDVEETLGVRDDLQRKIHACSMLARNGVTVLVSGASMPDHGEDIPCRSIEASSIERDESLQRFIRKLELGGLVPPPPQDLHPDEHGEIMKKLERLGYLEEE